MLFSNRKKFATIMKKNGYTVVELLVLIGIIALSAVLILPKLSLAFQDKREDIYKTDLRTYLKDAEIYGETKKEEIKSQDEYIVTIKELADAGYIVTINDDVKDPRNQSSMLGVKIKLSYDDTLDKVYAEIV